MIEGKKLRISILIIAKKYVETDETYQITKQLEARGVDYEVLLAEGDNPSIQRNELAKVALGDYLLFLDDDSLPDTQILNEYSFLINKYPNAVIFGGPSVLKIKETDFHKVLNFFFSSYLGIGPVRSRYNSLGGERVTNEKELILSNMLINKEYFIKLGGFNKNFYPGEENEFMKRDSIGKIIYSPRARVSRYPRETLKDFIFQMYSYGKGRAKHLNISFDDLIFLLPAFFSLYISILLLFLVVNTLVSVKIVLIPLLIYWPIIAISSLWDETLGKRASFFQAPCFFGIGHFFYGAGIWTGILKYKILKVFSKERKLTYLKIVRIKDF